MSEFSSLLDRNSLLIRHLIEMVKSAPANFDRLAFLGAIQAAGGGLDSINKISSARETKDYIIATRHFVESMISYVAAKGRNNEEEHKKNFLEKAARYQAAVAAVRQIAEAVDSSLPRLPDDAKHEENNVIVDQSPPRKQVDLANDKELQGLQSELNQLSRMSVPAKSRPTQQAAPKQKTESQGVTDKLFDYLGEVLDHNVLQEKAAEDGDALQFEDIPDMDLDAL